MKTMQLSLVYETFATNFLFIPASFALLNDMLARTVFTHFTWTEYAVIAVKSAILKFLIHQCVLILLLLT